MRRACLAVVMVVGLGCGGDDSSMAGNGGAGGAASGGADGTASGGAGGTASNGAGGTMSADAGAGMTTVTISGALTGTRTGDAPVLAWSPKNDTSDLLFNTVTTGPFLASFGFTFTGKPMMTTYTESTAGATCIAGATVPNTVHSWQARKAIMDQTDAGTCSLTFTSLTNLGSNGITEGYEAHGTFTATLRPTRDGDAQGMVMATFTF